VVITFLRVYNVPSTIPFTKVVVNGSVIEAPESVGPVGVMDHTEVEIVSAGTLGEMSS
jgi:hypothetical protein